MKRIFKALKIIVLVFLMLIVTIVTVFFIRNRILLGGKDKDSVTYLETHQQQINNDDDLKTISFADATVYLLGEIHGFGDVQTLDLSLLKTMHAEGVRYYIAEMDSIQAGKLNSFLSGEIRDTGLLKEIVQSHKRLIPQQAGQQLYEKWLSVYDFNHSLPDSSRIVVLGLDKDIDDKVNVTISRDSAMLYNFQQIVERRGLQNEKFYGLFGHFHVLQAAVGENQFRPFAARLKQSGINVKSIVTYPLDSKMYMPKGLGIPVPDDEQIGMVNADGPMMLVKGIRDLKAAAGEQKITFFDLDKEGTPYNNSQRLAIVKSTIMGEDIIPADESIPTTHYFQYVVLIQQSPAVSPLRN